MNAVHDVLRRGGPAACPAFQNQNNHSSAQTHPFRCKGGDGAELRIIVESEASREGDAGARPGDDQSPAAV